jgi:hypothetical protein
MKRTVIADEGIIGEARRRRGGKEVALHVALPFSTVLLQEWLERVRVSDSRMCRKGFIPAGVFAIVLSLKNSRVKA